MLVLPLLAAIHQAGSGDARPRLFLWAMSRPTSNRTTNRTPYAQLEPREGSLVPIRYARVHMEGR